MATAMESTIPCDRCNTQIDSDDWRVHVRTCVGNQKNQRNEETRTTTNDEFDNERIPCEYCQNLIAFDVYESHTKKCSYEHKRPTVQLKNDIDDEPTDVLIPCEYCETAINVHELERHTKQCATSRRGNSARRDNDEPVLIPCENCNTPVSVHDLEWHTRQCTNGVSNRSEKVEINESVLIPCEYCNAPVSALEWQEHTDKCAQADKQRIETLAKRIGSAPSNDLIPCDICNKSVAMHRFKAHQDKCGRKKKGFNLLQDAPLEQATADNFTVPDNWDATATKNLTRYNLDPGSEEYQSVANNFNRTLPTNKITQIVRIQNRRWYRQYEAHKDDFLERYGQSTERWLFHGCRQAESAEAIINDCFNRSHAVNCAVGQGIYFATDAAISHGYTSPDRQRLRHMFMARVLVGRTTRGNPSTRVCPPGFDTTGGGNVFVTYHDAQAYAQYLIIYQ